MNVQLPEAASLQRTNAVMRKIDEILKAEPGVRYVNAIAGYSLLSQTTSPRNGVYFCQLDALRRARNAGAASGRDRRVR